MRQELTYCQKTLRGRFLLDIERSDVCPFICRSPVGDKFLILRLILQAHIGLEQAIHQLFLLILGKCAGERRHKAQANSN